jgi:DNA (cytosine-5)-methyltransferase 1
MARPILLDLFCGAGGAARGYVEAGFEVVGIDHRPQPRYPYRFIQGDALDRELWPECDVIHASPPCQAYSQLAGMHPNRDYPMLIPQTRAALRAAEVPYVIENVVGAPLDDPLLLCGSMFGLRVHRGDLRRHRLFECSLPLQPLDCQHRKGFPSVGVYGHGGHSGKPRMLYKAEAAEIMEIDWMTRDELTQAIPPAYTRYIGGQLR